MAHNSLSMCLQSTILSYTNPWHCALTITKSVHAQTVKGYHSSYMGQGVRGYLLPGLCQIVEYSSLQTTASHGQGEQQVWYSASNSLKVEDPITTNSSWMITSVGKIYL